MHVDLSQSRADLRRYGLKLRILLGHPEPDLEVARKAKAKIQPPLSIVGIIDTGSSITVINPQVASTCGLRQTGTVLVAAVGAKPVSQPEFAASIKFPDQPLAGIATLRVVACPLPAQEGVACLLGRDILERWRLSYDGRTGEVTVDD
jgi:predicted aspartyl protease